MNLGTIEASTTALARLTLVGEAANALLAHQAFENLVRHVGLGLLAGRMHLQRAGRSFPELACRSGFWEATNGYPPCLKKGAA